ncbi:MAG TPA: hypothetical protein VEU32_21585 [Burkholderiales bacterium]|nr:hypothetical protein [Burkholderiales bacterium]
MRTGVSVLLTVLAGNGMAQAPATLPTEKQNTITPAPVTSQSTTPARKDPAPSRNQFFSPVMGIQIEGQGLGLPKGVAEDEPIKPAAPEPPATAPVPPASPK